MCRRLSTPRVIPVSEIDERIDVVGGGIGGLATAALLAAEGASVTVLERNERLGGSAGLIERDGFRFDTGPTWYLMPEVFERFFGRFDREPADYYELTHLDPHYRIHWRENVGPRPIDPPRAVDVDPTGDTVDVPPEPEAARAIFEAYERGGGASFDRYLETAAESYEIGMERFVYEDRSRFRDYLDLDVVRSARGLTFLGSMQSHVEDYFDHPKLQQLVQYTLVFLGGAPRNTPALYNLMSHVDFGLGVHYPDGGLYSVVEALVELGREQGVRYETDRPVTAIRRERDGLALETDGGSRRPDRVVCNANPAHVERDLLPDGVGRGEDYWASRTYAPSAFLCYLGVEGELPTLEHHTLVLPADWGPHFDTIFEEPAWPEDPAYYLCVPSKTDPTVAPDGHHAVVALVPIAPGLEDGPDRRRAFRERLLDDLATHAGADLRDRIVVEETACVSEFSERFDAPGGTALGLAHTLRQTGPLRPSHRGPLEGLHYVGGYVNPGIGVPMCLVGAEHTAAAVRADAGADDSGPLRGLLGRTPL